MKADYNAPIAAHSRRKRKKKGSTNAELRRKIEDLKKQISKSKQLRQSLQSEFDLCKAADNFKAYVLQKYAEMYGKDAAEVMYKRFSDSMRDFDREILQRIGGKVVDVLVWGYSPEM